MTQTKKQVEFYQKMIEQSKIMRKKKSLDNGSNNEGDLKVKDFSKKQGKPIANGTELDVSVDDDFLNSIFKTIS